MSGDTRVYSTTRLRSFHGYEETPFVDEGFEWKMPIGDRYYGREVEARGRRYELWSRNSLQNPYYPGYRPRASDLKAGNSLEQQHYDGQLGCFMTVPFHPAHSDDAANKWVMDVWVSEADSGYRGKLDPLFLKRLADSNTTLDAAICLLNSIRYSRQQLWEDRPQQLWSTALDPLQHITKYEEAVDQVQEIQRGLLEKEAWLRMAIAWRDRRCSAESMQKMPVLPAYDEFMGVWMHGISEEDMLFFLTCAAVPCFLVHELTAEEPRGEMVAQNFTATTIVSKYLEPYAYDVDQLALLANSRKFTASEVTLVTVTTPSWNLDLRMRLSSHWQLGLTSDDPTPSSRALLEHLRKESKEDKVSLGSENSGDHGDVPSVAVLSSSPEKPSSTPLRPLAVPTLTFPGMESTVVTAVLKFPELPVSFSPNDMSAWLTTAACVISGIEWRCIYLFKRSVRLDYFVEFVLSETALKVKGLIKTREGEIRECVFVGPTEYGKIQQMLKAVLERMVFPAKERKPSSPYAGGHYILSEPPVTTRLPDVAGAYLPPATMTKPQNPERRPVATLTFRRTHSRPHSLSLDFQRASKGTRARTTGKLESWPVEELHSLSVSEQSKATSSHARTAREHRRLSTSMLLPVAVPCAVVSATKLAASSEQIAISAGLSFARDVSLPSRATPLSLPFAVPCADISAAELAASPEQATSMGSSFTRDVALPFQATLLSLLFPSSIDTPIALPSATVPNSSLLSVQLTTLLPDTSSRTALPQSQFFLKLGEYWIRFTLQVLRRATEIASKALAKGGRARGGNGGRAGAVFKLTAATGERLGDEMATVPRPRRRLKKRGKKKKA
ncbi:hypothetical protein B0H13DRAFT_2339885 [Mycena leptocephala]|nr:hypothetical protein B0H13DRAFT_2339885 [Mycena leptocephala]